MELAILLPPLLSEGWGGHPLCLSGYSSVLMARLLYTLRLGLMIRLGAL